MLILLFMIICISISIVSIILMKRECAKYLEEVEAIRTGIILLKAAQDRSNIK